MRKTKKFVFTVLIIIFLLGIAPRQAIVAPVLAEGEQTQNASPSPDPSPSPSPDPSVTPQVEPSPSPSPSPDPCTSDCPPAVVDQSNQAAVDNTVTDVANTGGNQIGPSPSPEPEGLGTQEATGSASPDPSTSGQSPTPEVSNTDGVIIDTGNAIADVNVLNLTNTNVIALNSIYKIENIYTDAAGNIDLSQATVTDITPDALNVIADQTNSATVNNVITAIANTGNNLVNAASGAITTGAAYAIVNVFNFINTNLIGSHLQLVIINIFGSLTGNIILPEPQELDIPNNLALGDVTQQNSAELTNGVTNTANTGNNQVTSAGTIQTGNATSQTNVTNVVNTNFLGGIFYQLFVNNFGSWNGSFLGWGTTGASDPTFGTMIFDWGDPGLASTLGGFVSANQTNEATVNNQILASANTGGNSIYGQGGEILTGNAFSSVNLINFINTNIIASKVFFGIINIFGTLNGDIGGASYFATTTQTQAEPEIQPASVDQRVPGGQLSTEISTNVGTHVNPGDTVMFFITVKNIGTGPVYDGKLTFNLYDANDELGTIDVTDLGTLQPGQRAYISFGLVLSESAPAGLYQGLIKAEGKVGPDNEDISSLSDTYFQVGQPSFISSIIPEVEAASEEEETPPEPQQQQSGISYSENWGYIFLLMFFAAYSRMLQSLYKKRNEVEPF